MPRLMDVSLWDVFELRTPGFDMDALFVKIFRLFHGIEDQVSTWTYS